MYSNIASVQILVALLKQYDIRDVVLSPGGSDIPIIHSIENDSFFNCFSVVDERSAAYFALGVSQVRNHPVACVCTSGSAVCNYLPGITEAFYQNVPVIAITADKNPYFQGQLETQKIEQSHIFDGVVKKSVSLPLVNTSDDRWLCSRLIQEALLEMKHHGQGPVHINIPIVEDIKVYDQEILPQINPIMRFGPELDVARWRSAAEELSQSQKILVIIGQNVVFCEEDQKLLDDFFAKFNCVYAVEHLSNVNCNGRVFSYPISEMKNFSELHELVPDIVITLGNNLSAYNLKHFLRINHTKFKHWLVNESGTIRDIFKSLYFIFECTPRNFFHFMLEYAPASSINDQKYFDTWNSLSGQIMIPEFEFSNFYIAKRLSETIPPNSLLHTAILNSTRVMQFFPLAKGVESYSNVGTLGIDGCFSTFVGQASVFDGLSFLVIGDLSFFYDMNAAGIKHIGKNVRVVLLNNGGGAEFHFFAGKDAIPSINRHICAQHRKSAKGWIISLGFKYIAVNNKEELEKAISQLAQESEIPIFVEVFTDMEDDAKYTQKFYDLNKKEPSLNLSQYAHKAARHLISPEKIQKMKAIIDIIKK